MTMTTSERIRAVVNHEPVDRLPLFLEGICHGGIIHNNQRIPDQLERAMHYLDMGVDTGIVLEIPCFSFRDTEIKQWLEESDDEEYPLIYTRYRTPKGDLQQVVRKTEDYPGGDKLVTEQDASTTRSPDCLGIICDYNMPATRSKQYLIEKESDLEKLSCLLHPEQSEKLSEFHQQATRIRTFCDTHQIPFSVYVWGVGDPLMWMSGVERVLMMALEEKELLHRYIEIVSTWNRQLIEIAIQAGADHIIRRGWYESTDFWSPSLYEDFLLEPLSKDVELAHQAGLSFDYVMASGSMPLLQQIKKAGVDIYSNIDPMSPDTDLCQIKNTIGDSVALCGGVNNYHILEKGTEKQVETAVLGAIEIFTPPTGCILASSDVLFLGEPDIIDRNIQVMIQTWRDACN
jgi:hypothetical protein